MHLERQNEEYKISRNKESRVDPTAPKVSFITGPDRKQNSIFEQLVDESVHVMLWNRCRGNRRRSMNVTTRDQQLEASY